MYRYRIVGPNAAGAWMPEGTTMEQAQEKLVGFARYLKYGHRHVIERQFLGLIQQVQQVQ